MTTLLIGFAGAKRAGKTLATELLMQKHGVVGMGFAQPLRVFVGELLGLDADQLETHKETQVPFLREGVTPRTMLQTLGTEWGRQLVDPDIWVTVAMRSADAAREAGYAVAFADVRFPNEAEAIRSRGGIIVNVTREGTGSGDAHVSEAGLPAELVNYTIANDGTPSDLYDALLETLVEYKRVRDLRDSLVNIAPR